MKLKKFIKPLSANLNVVLVDVDQPVNSRNEYFPMIDRGIIDLGTARELRGIVKGYNFAKRNNYIVAHAELVEKNDETNTASYLAVYCRIQK